MITPPTPSEQPTLLDTSRLSFQKVIYDVESLYSLWQHRDSQEIFLVGQSARTITPPTTVIIGPFPHDGEAKNYFKRIQVSTMIMLPMA